jgi:membrane dipeptidase
VRDERASRVHREAVVVDGHSDVFCDVAERRRRGETRVLGRRHVPAWRAGGVDVVVATLYVEAEHKPDRALRRAVTLLGAGLDDVDETPEVALCRTSAAIDAAVAGGRIALVLAIEGGECLQDGVESLRVFHELGVRILGLTWNQRNLLAEGVGEARAGGGLTELGRRMVAAANRLGVVLDASHLSVESFWDLVEASRAPIIASHSNARALCRHPRNLDDDQIRAVAMSGGTVGIAMVSAFVNDDPGAASLDDALDHVDHIAALVGAEHVALGPDFADFLTAEPGLTPGEQQRAGTYIRGCDRIEALPNVTAGLLGRGYDEAAIRGILGGNLLRVLGAAHPQPAG